MREYTNAELEDALAAFRSSIGKCEKALLKLKEGSWQRKWTNRQLEAFYISTALIEQSASNYTKPQLTDAGQTLNVLTQKCEAMIGKLKAGSAQIILTERRLKAFRIALSLINK